MVTNCWSGGLTYVGFYPPCTTNYDPWAYNSWMYISPNDSTLNWYYYYDTDGFQAPGGCTTWWWTVGNAFNNYTDRHGLTSLWFKFDSHTTVHIGGVWC